MAKRKLSTRMRGYRAGKSAAAAGYGMPPGVEEYLDFGDGKDVYMNEFIRGFYGRPISLPKHRNPCGRKRRRNPGTNWLIIGGLAAAAYWWVTRKPTTPSVTVNLPGGEQITAMPVEGIHDSPYYRVR